MFIKGSSDGKELGRRPLCGSWFWYNGWFLELLPFFRLFIVAHCRLLDIFSWYLACFLLSFLVSRFLLIFEFEYLPVDNLSDWAFTVSLQFSIKLFPVSRCDSVWFCLLSTLGALYFSIILAIIELSLPSSGSSGSCDLSHSDLYFDMVILWNTVTCVLSLLNFLPYELHPSFKHHPGPFWLPSRTFVLDVIDSGSSGASSFGRSSFCACWPRFPSFKRWLAPSFFKDWVRSSFEGWLECFSIESWVWSILFKCQPISSSFE